MPVVEIGPSLRLLFPKLVQRSLYEDSIATPTTEHPSTGETPVWQSNIPDAAFLLHLPGFFTDFNRYRQKRSKVDASIFDSALSHTRRSDASEKKENCVPTFGRFRLWTFFSIFHFY